MSGGRCTLCGRPFVECGSEAQCERNRRRTYAVRVLSEAPRECLAVVHVNDVEQARTFAQSASEDGMVGEVFDVTREPARLVARFEGGALVVDGVVL